MKRNLIFLTLFLFACTILPKKTTEATAPSKNTEEIQSIVKKTVELSKPNRTVGRPGHKKVFEYIKTSFEKIAKAAGGKVYVHEFKPDIQFAVKNYQSDFDNLVAKKLKPTDPAYKKWDAFTKTAIRFVSSFKKFKGKNIVLEIPGSEVPSDVLYVGAHYDSITHNHETMEFTPDAPATGADDNASALAALIVTANRIASAPHRKTVRFIAFDYEEVFFLGSLAFARDLKGQKLKFAKKDEKYLGMINLEMLGWSSKALKDNPAVKIYTRPENKEDMNLAEAVKSSSPDSAIDVQILANGFNRSDNWPFWETGLFAITVSEDWEKDFNEKNYHTTADVPESLNYPYLQEATDLVSHAVAKLAN